MYFRTVIFPEFLGVERLENMYQEKNPSGNIHLAGFLQLVNLL